MKVLLVAAGLGLAGLLVLRYVLGEGVRKVVTTASKDRVAECLTLAGSTTREEQGSTYIIGSVRNRCETRFSHVTVVFKLDRRDSKVTSLPEASIMAYLNGVKAGETREFKSAFRIDKNTSCRFDRITAF
jgi:hypothetical protein